jgi:hypothetical protein
MQTSTIADELRAIASKVPDPEDEVRKAILDVADAIDREIESEEADAREEWDAAARDLASYPARVECPF